MRKQAVKKILSQKYKLDKNEWNDAHITKINNDDDKYYYFRDSSEIIPITFDDLIFLARYKYDKKRSKRNN